MEKDWTVCISKANAKMGEIKSISLPPVTTCRPNCPCVKMCYARKIANLRPKTVGASYERNLRILNERPDIFWKSIEVALLSSTVFRFMVSGDIPNKEFLEREVELIRGNPQCQVVQFTKRYEWVNEYLEKGNELPSNLHLIFSGWKGLQMSNPFLLPECHVLYKDGTTTAHDGKTFLCSGNCFECFKECKNCFSLEKAEQILIKQH